MQYVVIQSLRNSIVMYSVRDVNIEIRLLYELYTVTSHLAVFNQTDTMSVEYDYTGTYACCVSTEHRHQTLAYHS
ncbi:hypothetical protein [Sporosarcina limicola]|uniref:Uncharacterized protein n=1 Tax=Sporosarcina limicola TaxID=34101 RepID=A0A927R4H0_9BACL|nr:hypothetical protein [Sporosarcina limicola]MBE1554883.1 hypothetical protein [Sporosarcina limicola]